MNWLFHVWYIFFQATVPINQQSDVSSAKNKLYFLLGCRAVIPCQPYSYSDSFKWFYKKGERSDQIQIFFQDKNGIQYHHISWSKWSKWSIGSNHSLVINYFTEDDEGMYWCETCQEMCQKSTVITVEKGLYYSHLLFFTPQIESTCDFGIPH